MEDVGGQGRDQSGEGQVLDLVVEELRDLTETVMRPDAPEPFGLYVFPSSHPGAELGRHVERTVFDEFFDNSPEMLAEEYDPYEPASLFFCVIDHRRELPAGALRVIVPNDVGFKSLDDIERVWEQPLDAVIERTGIDWDERRLWDVATVAVEADYRGSATEGLASLTLYQGFAQAGLRAGVEWGVAVLDVIVLDLIQGVTGQPFDYFRGVEPRRYLDSPSSVPVWIDGEAWVERMRVDHPDIHAILVEGQPIGPAMGLPDWDEVSEMIAEWAPWGTLAPDRLAPSRSSAPSRRT